MKNIFLLCIIGIVLTSCGAKKNTIEQANQFGKSNGYNILTKDIIAKKQFTPSDLMELATYISEGVDITERVIPDSQDASEKSFIDENGTLVDLTEIKINQGSIADGYKGPIERGERIYFVEKKNEYYVYRTASDIYLHFKIGGFGYSLGRKDNSILRALTLVKLSNFDGVYDQSKFNTTYVLFRYRREQRVIN